MKICVSVFNFSLFPDLGLFSLFIFFSRERALKLSSLVLQLRCRSVALENAYIKLYICCQFAHLVSAVKSLFLICPLLMHLLFAKCIALQSRYCFPFVSSSVSVFFLEPFYPFENNVIKDYCYVTENQAT